MLNIANKIGFSFLLAVAAMPATATVERGSLSLEEGFANPPRSCRPETWWWFGDCAAAPEAAITRDLEGMKKVGLSAFHIYGGNVQKPGWLPKAKFALKEANRLGLDAYLMIGTAGCGHPDTPLRFATKDIVFSISTAERAKDGSIRAKLPKKWKPHTPIKKDGTPELFTDITCLAVPSATNAPVSSVRDVSAFLDRDNDAFAWPSAPEGKWTIVRCAYVPRKFGWMGCYIDHLSRAALDDHWARVVTPVLKALSKDERAALKGVLCDSWEADTASWTPAFIDDFKRMRGYDPTPWLPVKCGVKIGTETERKKFLRDFNVTLGELIAENHYAYKRELAHREGLISIAEAAGPHQRMGDVRMMQGRCDVAMGEFWMPSDHRPEDSQRFMLRDAATAAHVYGIPEVLSESFTTIGTYWTESPETLKPCADRAFCDGLTRVCYHGMMLSPSLTDRPGKIRSAAQHYNPQNTWFYSSGAFNLYLSRCSWMLSRGRFAADALVYAGDAINLFASLKNDEDALGRGYDYDFCPTEILVKARVENGEVVLPSGMRYRVLVIADKNPASKRMDTKKLPPKKKLPPVTPYVPEEGAEAIARLERGGVKILRTRADRATWTAANAPDFRVLKADNPESVDWIHRITDEGDIYFVASRHDAHQRICAEFRTTAPRVELWDAVTGRRVKTPFERQERTTRVAFELASGGSVFVVFRADVSLGCCDLPSPVVSTQLVDGPWQVQFDPKWGGPEAPVKFDLLTDWISSADPGIRHYSGTATYSTTVALDAPLAGGERLALNLGEVKNVADVSVNGRYVGTAWTSPFEVEIPKDTLGTDMTKPFRLEVKVTNLWPNRLVADSALPKQKRLTRTNINPYKPGDPLLSSGLLGPVSLVRRKEEGTGKASSGSLVLARRGEKPRMTVVVRRDASPSERYAAEELVRYVEKMTDVRLPIADDSGTLPERAIVLGMTRHTSALAANAAATRKLGEDGFRLLSVPPHLLVIGSHRRGVLYGVYELLETYGGVGWFASWHEVVPKRDEFAVPARLDDTQTPTFVLRRPSWEDMTHHPDFAVRSRMNGQMRSLEPRHGGIALCFVGGLGSCHTFDTLLPCSKWFKSHPEYFSEVNGVRRDGRTQLCLTNPDVLRLVVSNVLARIETDRRTRKDPVPIKVVGVSPNDWRYYCTCEKCRAVDEEEGTQTGSLLRFVNRVAEGVEKVYPDFFVETLIYSYTRTPPRLVRPRHNVIPCLCSYECSFAQPLSARNLPVNVSFMDDLAKWGSYSGNLYLWDYTTDYSHYLYPMPNVLTLQPNIQTFRDNGVKYYFAEGGPYHADFAELKAWLIAKLSWNCDRPLDPLLRQFFTGYYGAAAPFVRRYFDEVESLLRNDPKGRLTIWEHDRPRVYTDDFLRRARATFRQAEEAVRDDPVRLMHVRRQEAVPVCVWLDRKGKTVKRFWVTRHPERFELLPGLKEDVRWMRELQKQSEKAGRHVPIANRADKEERSFEMWRYIEEFKRPDAPCDSLALGVDDIHFGGKKFGRIVKDPTAHGGKAIEAWNYAEGEAAAVHFGHVAFDADVQYRVRIHVRADAAENGRGEAFCCRFGGKTIAPRIEETKPGWQWYEFEPRKLHEDFVLSFSSGRFANGGGSPAVKGVRIDRVEIVADSK